MGFMFCMAAVFGGGGVRQAGKEKGGGVVGIFSGGEGRRGI